jgi:hypothetical protein
MKNRKQIIVFFVVVVIANVIINYTNIFSFNQEVLILNAIIMIAIISIIYNKEGIIATISSIIIYPIIIGILQGFIIKSIGIIEAISFLFMANILFVGVLYAYDNK